MVPVFLVVVVLVVHFHVPDEHAHEVPIYFEPAGITDVGAKNHFMITKRRRMFFQTQVIYAVEYLMPVRAAVPIEIRRLILEFSGLLHVGRNTLMYHCYV